MFMDLQITPLVAVLGTFMLGWVTGRVGAALKARSQAKKRDPRDDRIRGLDAELRIANSEAEKAREKLAALDKELSDAKKSMERRDDVITEQQGQLLRLRADLKDSVRKTRELRAELSDRAEESVRSQVKLREVETELSVAQASTDFIATGVLDYNMVNDDLDEGEAQEGQVKFSGGAG